MRLVIRLREVREHGQTRIRHGGDRRRSRVGGSKFLIRKEMVGRGVVCRDAGGKWLLCAWTREGE